MTCDYTNPNATDEWWHRNPLASGTYCPTCDTRLTDSYGVVHPCPLCERSAA